jgi:hypothetical protein
MSIITIFSTAVGEYVIQGLLEYEYAESLCMLYNMHQAKTVGFI